MPASVAHCAAVLGGLLVRMGRRCLPAAGILLAAIAPGEAAVRFCKEPVAGETIQDASEKAARKRALETWTAKAKVLLPNAIWRLAAERSITCTRIKPGLHECSARGRPCTIRQVPSPGGVPLKRPPPHPPQLPPQVPVLPPGGRAA